MALLTLDDLAGVMGRASRPFEGDEIPQAQYVIDQVTAFVLNECEGLAFEVTDVVEERMQADYIGLIEIRKYPVLDITEVKNWRDRADTWWDWDDFDTIIELDPFQTVAVTYSYGFSTTPVELNLVAKGLAYRGMSNPLGVRQQTVGAISETYSVPGLTGQEDAILDGYRRHASSLRLGPQTAKRIRQLPTL